MVIIVGHGASLAGQGRGEEIDSFPVVIRLRFGGKKTEDNSIPNPKDCGTKKTILAANAQSHKIIKETEIHPDGETWLFSRPGDISEDYKKQIFYNFVMFNPVICTESDKWLKRYDEMGAKGFDGHKPIPGNGTIVTLIAMERLKPKKIYLAGFDAFWDKSITRRSNHDLVCERKLLKEASKHYGVELVKF